MQAALVQLCYEFRATGYGAIVRVAVTGESLLLLAGYGCGSAVGLSSLQQLLEDPPSPTHYGACLRLCLPSRQNARWD